MIKKKKGLRMRMKREFWASVFHSGKGSERWTMKGMTFFSFFLKTRTESITLPILSFDNKWTPIKSKMSTPSASLPLFCCQLFRSCRRDFLFPLSRRKTRSWIKVEKMERERRQQKEGEEKRHSKRKINVPRMGHKNRKTSEPWT